MKKIIKNERGATLIDLLISTAIMLSVTGSFYNLLLSFYENYGLQEAIAEMQQQARVADDLISREIRQGGYDPTGTLFIKQPNGGKLTKEYSNNHCAQGSHPAERIFEATPILFHYLADLNGNGMVNNDNDVDEDVRYEWIDAAGKDSCGNKRKSFALYRDSGSGGGAQEVAFNIEGFRFGYFDEDGNELIGHAPDKALDQEQRNRIRKVVLTLIVKTDRKDSGARPNQRAEVRQRITEVSLPNM